MPHSFVDALVPRPQSVTVRGGSHPPLLQLRPLIRAPSAADALAIRDTLHRLFATRLSTRVRARTLLILLDPTAGIAPRSAGRAIAEQAYRLEFGPALRLVASGLAGVRFGLQTLRQLLEGAGHPPQPAWPILEIRDWPRLAVRGIHLDLAREMEYRPAHLRRVVDHLAALKFNTLHLYLENKFVFPSAPELAPPRVMTPDQARALCRFAADRGIQVIPQLATLGHMEHLLQGRFAELREKADSAYNLCPSHPGARPFLAGLLTDVQAAFRSPFIHVGYDESHSGICPRCQARGTPPEILADHLNWLNDQVRALNARTLIYGDKFLAAADFPRADAVHAPSAEAARQALARVHRDILITDWHYTAPYGGTVRYLVNEGFDVHIAPATNLYWHDAIPLHRGHHWIVPTIDQAVAEGATGVMHTNWEFYRGQFFDNFWFFQALSAERGWSGAPHDYTGWGRRFARCFWGLPDDPYSELAGLAETLPVGRRRFFVDSSVLAVEIPSALNPLYPEWRQIRFDHVEAGEELIRQARRFLKSARRNADTLRILDMPGQIARYLGLRAVAREALLAAARQGLRSEARRPITTLRRAARQVLRRLEFGYRVYGGAVKDRARLQSHLQDLDRLDGILRDLPDAELRALDAPNLLALLRAEPESGTGFIRSFFASPLLPAPPDIRSVARPAPQLAFQPAPYLDDLRLVDIRTVHHGQPGLIYLKTRIHSSRAHAARLLYGVDGPARLWVNGRAVDCRPQATNPAVADQYAVALRLRTGANHILFALNTNGGQAWGLVCRLIQGASSETPS